MKSGIVILSNKRGVLQNENIEEKGIDRTAEKDGCKLQEYPMDINMNYSEDDSPLALKADFVLSLCELIVGGREGLQPVEKTVIDRSIHQIYRKYLENPVPENMPLLEDLYDTLLEQPEPEARRVATALELYRIMTTRLSEIHEKGENTAKKE